MLLKQAFILTVIQTMELNSNGNCRLSADPESVKESLQMRVLYIFRPEIVGIG